MGGKKSANDEIKKAVEILIKNLNNTSEFIELTKNSLFNIKLSEEEQKLGKLTLLYGEQLQMLNQIKNMEIIDTKYDEYMLTLKGVHAIDQFIYEELIKSNNYIENINGTNMPLLSSRLNNIISISAAFNDIINTNLLITNNKITKFNQKDLDTIISKYFDSRDYKRVEKLIKLEIDSRITKQASKKFIARNKDEIAKAAFDFFSIGHILMGQFIFFILYSLFLYVPAFENWIKPQDFEVWCFIASIILGIIWEPFENIIMMGLGLKFESRKDSILNMIFDIVFVFIGGLVAYIINNWHVNLVLVIIEFIAFFIVRHRIYSSK